MREIEQINTEKYKPVYMLGEVALTFEVVGTPISRTPRFNTGFVPAQTSEEVIKMCHEAGIYDCPQPHHRPVRRKFNE